MRRVKPTEKAVLTQREQAEMLGVPPPPPPGSVKPGYHNDAAKRCDPNKQTEFRGTNLKAWSDRASANSYHAPKRDKTAYDNEASERAKGSPLSRAGYFVANRKA